MRFVYSILLIYGMVLFGLNGSAFAQDTSVYEDYTPLIREGKLAQPRIQRGRQAGQLQSLETLSHRLYARRLGQISAITGENGIIYTADKQSGQIFRMTDRDMNGRHEGVRPLPHRFDAPTGLALSGGVLYVADKSAVWRVGQAGTPQILAGLTNIKTNGQHVLRAGDKPDHLWLGLTSQDGKAKLLRLSTQSGQAELIDEVSGQLLDLANTQTGQPWALIRQGKKIALGPSFKLLTEIGADAEYLGLLLGRIEGWPISLSQHAIISRPKSGDVMAVPIVLARPIAVGKSIFSGFTSASGRSAWGQTGPLYTDKNGVFVSDKINGDLWLISSKPEPRRPAAPAPEKSEPENQAAAEISQAKESDQNSETSSEPEAESPFASSIKKGSLIEKASTLERGSRLEPRDTKKLEAEDKAKQSKSD